MRPSGSTTSPNLCEAITLARSRRPQEDRRRAGASQIIAPDIVVVEGRARGVAFMMRDFRFDEGVERNFSEATVKTLKVFPRMLGSLEGLLHNYHKDNSAGLVERSPLPLENLNASGRQIATMFLTKIIYYSRAIIDNVNSRNLLVAFQSMRALVEVVAAVRHTLEKLEPLIHECSSRGIVTARQAHQLNYHCDLLLHGGRFDWEHYFENGAWAVLERKGKQRSNEERQKFEERARYLKIEKCIESWSKKQPLARFAYDYLCDLVHPNKGSNLVLLVKREQSVLFNVDGSIELGHLIFDRIFPLVIKLCMNETDHLFVVFAFLGADEERVKTLAPFTES
jgi:hypothetical protein